eukprot:1730384-Amphidinium_carterae.2
MRVKASQVQVDNRTCPASAICMSVAAHVLVDGKVLHILAGKTPQATELPAPKPANRRSAK